MIQALVSMIVGFAQKCHFGHIRHYSDGGLKKKGNPFWCKERDTWLCRVLLGTSIRLSAYHRTDGTDPSPTTWCKMTAPCLGEYVGDSADKQGRQYFCCEPIHSRQLQWEVWQNNKWRIADASEVSVLRSFKTPSKPSSGMRWLRVPLDSVVSVSAERQRWTNADHADAPRRNHRKSGTSGTSGLSGLTIEDIKAIQDASIRKLVNTLSRMSTK